MAETIINSDQAFDAYLAHLKSQWDSHHYLRVTLKTGKQRSATQNACLHLYCNQLSVALNDAGWDMKQLLDDDFEIPWTEYSVKDILWRKIQKAMFGKSSTTKPERKEYPQIYDALNRVISNKTGVFVPWPSKDTMNNEAHRNEK